jgi:acetyltransferase-like isoleucine patch superfamily enzyme
MSVTLGKYSYGQIKEIAGQGQITVGNFCSIAGRVMAFMAQDHNYRTISSYPFDHPGLGFGQYIQGKSDLEESNTVDRGHTIVVGSDVWLGFGCILFRGITIGHGAVVGAFSIVAGDVAPYSIVVGNPAREIRKRFSDNDIEFLLRLAWWDLPDKEIGTIAQFLQTRNMDLLRKWAETHKGVI